MMTIEPRIKRIEGKTLEIELFARACTLLEREIMQSLLIPPALPLTSQLPEGWSATYSSERDTYTIRKIDDGKKKYDPRRKDDLSRDGGSSQGEEAGTQDVSGGSS